MDRQFEIRMAEGLTRKPTKADVEGAAVARTNPFLPPYEPSLFVMEENFTEEGETQGEDFVILVSLAKYHSSAFYSRPASSSSTSSASSPVTFSS